MTIFAGRLFLCLFYFWSMSNPPVTIRVTVQIANLRSSPESGGPVIAQYKLGDLLKASEKVGSWYQVPVIDETGKMVNGFIHESIVEVVSSEKPVENIQNTQPGTSPQNPPPVSAPPRMAQPRSYALSANKRGVKLIFGADSSGITQSGISDPPVIERKRKSGYLGGLGFEIGGSHLLLEMDLLYFPCGSIQITPDSYSNTLKFTYNTRIITAPLLLKARFRRRIMPFVTAGGEIGFILSHKVVIASPAVEVENNIIGEINRIYYGAVFGGGVEFALGKISLLLEGRYHHGLSNQLQDFQPGQSLRFRSIAGTFAIRF